MFKTVFFSLIAATLAFAAPALAAEGQLIRSNDAVLNFCSPGLADCGGAWINVDGHSYRARGATTEIQKQLSDIADAYEFQKMTRSQPFAVIGYLTVVHNPPGGWVPPTQTVFVITSDLSRVPVPR